MRWDIGWREIKRCTILGLNWYHSHDNSCWGIPKYQSKIDALNQAKFERESYGLKMVVLENLSTV